MSGLMRPTRRTFLRVLGAGMVGLGLIPALPPRPWTHEAFGAAYHAAADSGEPLYKMRHLYVWIPAADQAVDGAAGDARLA